MIVHFAKVCTDTGRIWTGSCHIEDFAEQEAATATAQNPGAEFVVQTERHYSPDELTLDTATWTIRTRGDGADVAQPPMTAMTVRAIAAALREQSHSSDLVNGTLVRIAAAKSFREIDAILADAGLSV
jgi:hypothetical protein